MIVPVSPTSSLRPATRRPARYALAACALGLVAAGVFLPSLNAGFVSDAFYFLEDARRASLRSLMMQFLPSAGTWYRPTTVAVFWLEYRLFGLHPFGYHAVALVCHVASSVLIFFVGRHTTRDARAAAVAAGAFLFTVHAHEVVFDIADLHNALSGVTLLACVLAYLENARAASLLLATLTLTVDETGMLTLPLLALYEAVFRSRVVDRRALAAAVSRLAPFVALSVAYVLFRSLVGGDWKNEAVPCRTVKCLAVAVLEYVNRLVVRPDVFLSAIWVYRPLLAMVSVATIATLLVLLRPWAWRQWRPALFGAGWLAGSTLFFILALYPYVADRFVYVPDMGLALLLGATAAGVLGAWRGASAASLGAMAFAAGVVLIWLAVGAPMLVYRGHLWGLAGARAQEIIERTVSLLPDPPPNATIIFQGVPDSYSPHVPPGNTGPYLFRNGFESALRIRYGRSDIQVRQGASARDQAIVLTIDQGTVSRLVESVPTQPAPATRRHHEAPR
jgi:hypothetical protein